MNSALAAAADSPAKPSILWLALGVATLLLVIAVRYAEPIGDGDLFWHMMYAKQMLARGSLTVDHTLYSWTPASNVVIYNAWVSELVLYAMYEWFGLWSLFVLRYVILIVVLAWAWRYADRVGQGRSLLTFLLLMLLAVAAAPGALVKPEMFSLLFVNIVVGAYFRARLAHDAREAIRWLYVVPVIVWAWANAHGGFVLIAPFLAATAFGEALNGLLAPKAAMPWRVYRHLLGAWALCCVAVLLTPYGPAYPIQLAQDYFFGLRSRPDVAWNLAYQSIFFDSDRMLHFVPILAVMLGLIVAHLWRWVVDGAKGQRIDWITILANLACLPLFVAHVRSTYLLPVVAVYSVLYLSSFQGDAPPQFQTTTRRSRRKPSSIRHWWRQAVPMIPSAGAVALALVFGGRAIYGAWFTPVQASWFGFGIGYGNPVAEAEYLARNRLGPRLYNIFDSGGYLLWRLDPNYKVMVDSRSFPYLAWFDDQYRFTTGEMFDEFVKRYVGDTAIIDLAKSAAVRNFMRSPDWRLIYYGPTAAVFVRRDFLPAAPFVDPAPNRFQDLRNAEVAQRLFEFAASAADYRTAWNILRQLEARLSDRADKSSLKTARTYRDAHQALRTKDYAGARSRFDEVFTNRLPGDQDRLIMVFLDQLAISRVPGNDNETRRYEAALEKLAAPEP